MSCEMNVNHGVIDKLATSGHMVFFQVSAKESILGSSCRSPCQDCFILDWGGKRLNAASIMLHGRIGSGCSEQSLALVCKGTNNIPGSQPDFWNGSVRLVAIFVARERKAGAGGAAIWSQSP